ncbi:hypothetical protein H7J08_12950 [Mycobacterium frederiksbergense]|jgi:hypothetical protein|uniref:STAS domain-containing protein n=1 Tax=Mycolicibacterium frederiksbergense TaxID=117567 RepID=A0A6H0S606_9MYCO|nr:hypothetical protein [Mycolicibacterium frederiksbergense]MCV7045567.1 hypothetical protein [Mycolicibacterium frederiksbergense]QIV82081.1 hypothetical protein EXE63_15265 [Mycolicibacterium frederiksbergense]
MAPEALYHEHWFSSSLPHQQMEADMTDVQSRMMQSPRGTAWPQPAGGSPAFEMSTRWLTFDVAVLSVEGQLNDAATAELLEYASSKALLCRLLILNLERVRSLSRGGYDMLRMLESRCAAADVALSVLHGRYADTG